MGETWGPAAAGSDRGALSTSWPHALKRAIRPAMAPRRRLGWASGRLSPSCDALAFRDGLAAHTARCPHDCLEPFFAYGLPAVVAEAITLFLEFFEARSMSSATCCSWPAVMVRCICRTASAVWSPALFPNCIWTPGARTGSASSQSWAASSLRCALKAVVSSSRSKVAPNVTARRAGFRASQQAE